MPAIKLKGVEYNLRYTIESWKKLKEKDIDLRNVQSKMEENFGEVISELVFYGLSIADRAKINKDELDAELDLSVMEIVEKTIFDSLPAKQRALAKKAEASAGLFIFSAIT